MRILWICGLPAVVQEKALEGEDHGAKATWSWVVGHLPPPSTVELHIACLWPGGTRRKSFEFEKTTFHLVPCPRKGRAISLFQMDTNFFRPVFDEIRPEVVHGWGTEDSYGLVARRLAPEQHIIGIQGIIRNCYRHLPVSYRTLVILLTERITLKKARYVVAESHYALNAAAPLCPVAMKRVVEQPLRHAFLVSPPSEGTVPSVLFVGTIQQSKGIMDALVAFSRSAPDSWSLHVVGAGMPEDENRMHRFVRSAGMVARFRHSRRLNEQELVKVMHESSVFLLPTRVDSGPTALKEALTMGLWPLCYNNSGPAEYIRKYAFGSLAQDGNVNSLCEELRNCLIQMPWRNGDRLTALIRRTREDFSPGRAWDHLTDLYQTVASDVRCR